MTVSFTLDGFRLLYFITASVSWLFSLLFTPRYMKHYSNKTRYYVFTVITYFATIGVFLSADLMTTFLFFEIMSLASYVWVAQDEKKASLRAADTYMGVAVLGGLVLLMGLFLLYRAAGTLVISDLPAAVSSKSLKELYPAAFCLFFGFGAKAGAFPLHIWLPKAHPVAPAPASALLSGILTKAGIYGILITAFLIVPGKTFGFFVLIIGLITMLVGAMLAIFSVDLKRTLASSSVSQIGFILSGIGAGAMLPNVTLGAEGAVLHMMNHSLIKLVLFLSAGVVFENLHELDLNKIQGFGRRKPILMLSFLSGALGIGGIPLWNGYVSKTLLHEAIVETGEVCGGFATLFEWLFLISGGFTVAYMTKLFVCIFVEKNNDERRQEEFDQNRQYMSPLQGICIFLPALALPIFGVCTKSIMRRISTGTLSFMNISESAKSVSFFSFECIKGGLISIAIGALLYVLVVRLLLYKENYLDRWPKWLDLEDGFYRPLLLKWLPGLFGLIFSFLDRMADIIIDFLKKTVYRPIYEAKNFESGEAIPYYLGNFLDTIRKIFKKEDKNPTYKEKFKLLFTEWHEGRWMVYRTLSYGLLMACVGIFLVLIYILLLVL